MIFGVRSWLETGSLSSTEPPVLLIKITQKHKQTYPLLFSLACVAGPKGLEREEEEEGEWGGSSHLCFTFPYPFHHYFTNSFEKSHTKSKTTF
jgi:hypothetical protein